MISSRNMGVLLLFVAVFLAGCSQQPAASSEAPQEEAFTGELREFKIEAFQFGFEPSVIEVSKGDKVRIIATSRDVAHGLMIQDFGINLFLERGTEQTAEFIADKSGEFTFSCTIYCGSGHARMRGRLIVR